MTQPNFVEVQQGRYHVYTQSVFGFAMVESDLKFVKGTKRHLYSLGFKEIIRMCSLDAG